MMTSTLLSNLTSRLGGFFLRPHYPGDVLEILEDRCTAVSIVRKNGRIGIRGLASQDLPRGALDPHFSQRNFGNEQAVSEICARLLKDAGIARGPLTLLIPEACVKVTLHDDFETIPAEIQYAKEMALHKLKKVLPFTTQEAAIALCPIHSAPNPLLLSVVMHGAILAQYEAIATAIGYTPGCVDIPSFNLLPAIEQMSLLPDPAANALVVSVDRSYFSQTLLSGGHVVLFRTKARNILSSDGPVEPQLRLVLEEVITTLRYYEDKLSSGAPIGSVLVRDTNGHANALRDLLHSELASPVHVLDLQPLLLPGAEMPPPGTAQMLLPLAGAALR
ncbi:MAG: hypothetical protein HYX75_09685 [Acidobacteria bacterium]|nr:hypothetical protein [Acidobacteriota bacterium]